MRKLTVEEQRAFNSLQKEALKIANIWKRKVPHWIDGDIFENVALECLHKAIEAHSPGKASLKTFASECIKRGILLEIRNQNHWNRREVKEISRRNKNNEELEPWMYAPLSIDIPISEDNLCNPENILTISISRNMTYKDIDNKLRIYQALSKLPKRDASMLYLVYVIGFNLKPVAEYYGVSVQRVCQILQRAKAKMRKELENEPI